MSEWQPIETAPRDCKDILVAFKGQFDWMMFVAQAFGRQTNRPGYAAPTHWMPLPTPPDAALASQGNGRER